MPGPSNTKKKRKSQGKPQTNYYTYNRPRSSTPDYFVQNSPSCSPVHTLESLPCATITGETPLIQDEASKTLHERRMDKPMETDIPPLPLPQPPLLYDPGNGPRVRNMRAFLSSKFFVQPPALEIPLCAEFAQDEVLEMLMTVLPEEMALILWYNKSRATSRICPACQRIYRLGDILPDHFTDEKSKPKPLVETCSSPQLRREQSLSGLCSPVCFIVASLNYPDAIRSAWGRTEEEFDDHTWALLNGPAENNATGDTGQGLSMLMRMSRLHDLGLAQLCLGLDVEDLRHSQEHF